MENYSFIGSSILFIVDSVETDRKYSIKFIDFAHVEKIEEPDSNVIGGIKNLVKILKEMQN